MHEQVSRENGILCKTACHPMLAVCNSYYQAFLGFERGQRCFPKPMISNDAGTERITYQPAPTDRLGNCVNEDGTEEPGLTYEGELNKVG